MNSEQTVIKNTGNSKGFTGEMLELIKCINCQSHKALLVYLLPESEEPKPTLLSLLQEMASIGYLCFLCKQSNSGGIEILEENLILVHQGLSLMQVIRGLSAIILATQDIPLNWRGSLDHKLLWFHADTDTLDDKSKEILKQADLISYVPTNVNEKQYLSNDRSLCLLADQHQLNTILLEKKIQSIPKAWQVYANINLQGKVAVMTATFLDYEGEFFYSGGAERYLLDLSEICEELGTELVVFQYGNYPWMRRFKNIDIISLSRNGLTAEGWILKCAREFNRVFYEQVQGSTALNIYSAFYEAWPLAATPNIGISHGVSWDNPYCVYDNAAEFWLMNQRHADGGRACEELVSVDTNTANWFQTMDFTLSQRIRIIPNYVDLSTFKPAGDHLAKRDKVVILYPRQLYSARGLYLVLNIIEELLEEHPEVEFHFVGRGGEQDINEVINKQSKWPGRIKYYPLAMDEMPQAYQGADISLIPSVHSEGTSLSCLEAMASGNAVIATRIGGLTDLIINNYNGFLIDPRPEELKQAIVDLLNNREQMNLFKQRNIQVAQAFSKELWRNRWMGLINSTMDKKLTKSTKSQVIEIRLGEGPVDYAELGEIIMTLLTNGDLVYVRTSEVPDLQLCYARIQWLGPDTPLFAPCDLTIEWEGGWPNE